MKPKSTPFWLGYEILDFFRAPLEVLVGNEDFVGEDDGMVVGHLLCLPFLGLVLLKLAI